MQAENEAAEKCIRFTRAEGYWVDLPLLPIHVDEPSRRFVKHVMDVGGAAIDELFTQARDWPDFWHDMQDFKPPDQFRRHFIQPLVFHGLLSLEAGVVRVGSAWSRLEPYYRTLEQIAQEPEPNSLQKLAETDWFVEEELELHC